METDREKISFKRDKEDDINSIEVVYEVVSANKEPNKNLLYLHHPLKIK